MKGIKTALSKIQIGSFLMSRPRPLLWIVKNKEFLSIEI
jgi:hypothetical protein